jgi:surface carbohydrate biosynthesis protein
MNKWIFIPYEIKAREFDARLLLACFAAASGYKVIFGSNTQIKKNLLNFPKGVFFDKSISKKKVAFIKKLKANGHFIVSIDEEGLSSFNNKELYQNQRISAETLQLVDAVMTWGQVEYDTIIEKYPEYQQKIHVTGNPRVDLWRPEFRSLFKEDQKNIEQRYGKFILMPTSFGVVHHQGREFLIKQGKRYGTIKTEEDLQAFNTKLDFLEKVVSSFVSLIHTVADTFQEYTVIVRPHPSEDHQFWKKELQQLRNVKIIYEGNVTGWILASEAVVHSTCTTGLEAFLLGKPVIAFLPYLNNNHVKHIANELSHQAYAPNEVLDRLKKVLSGNYSQSVNADNARKHIANIDGEFSIRTILKQIDTLDIPTHGLEENITINSSINLKKELKKLKEKLLRKKNYVNQKNPGFSEEELLRRVQTIVKLMDVPIPNVKMIGQDLVMINS